MACDYDAIRRDNERRYGTDIGRIGPMLLADRYDDRTHFIFELLQNAEDAIARRPGWKGSRSVSFNLTKNTLRFSHYGKLFDEEDVRGICGIAESTKDLTAIGRFGIGFKSVYAFTDRPEVHSGEEDFAIESFVWPASVVPVKRDRDETRIVLPLRSGDAQAFEEIARGLRRLGATALLFLRQIEGILWDAEGESGLYLRESKEVTPGVRRVVVIGQEQGKPEVDQTWLIFSRNVSEAGRSRGHVEIAFALIKDDESGHENIQGVERSPLVVFFPTVLETHLGFLVQGPYRTTPSRDNVPRNDPWNKHLVDETASLLVEALHWLRDQEFLDTAALECLPLDPEKFPEGSMLRPLFDATKQALFSEPLLPRFERGHVAGACARLGRTQELRELFTPSQLAFLFGDRRELFWLSGEITQDRTPDLRRYLIDELEISEVTPESLVPKLHKSFLEAQSDEWVFRLYEFLSNQPALRHRLDDIPLIRLNNGRHVTAHSNGRSQAFLPSAVETGFPTVRAAVCKTDEAREFLQSLGLTEPDPVDDVIWNVLPKYRLDADVSDADYEADIRRILKAFATDSKEQSEKLVGALQEAAFVKAVDSGDGLKCMSKPGDVYLATERLRELFAGVPNVLLVADSYICLRGEGVRELLEACGATRYLQPIPVEAELSWEDRHKIRRDAGLERATWEYAITDATLRGLDTLLSLLPRFAPEVRQRRAALLWEGLTDLENRRGSRAFSGEYSWRYAQISKTATFDAAFIRQLNAVAWVPDENGELQRPEFVLFDRLGWKPNPFLQSKIRFKPPIIEMLAQEAGIEPGVLDLLKKIGLTSETELRERLGLNDEEAPAGDELPDSDKIPVTAVGDRPAEPTVLDLTDPDPSGSYGVGATAGAGSEVTAATGGAPGPVPAEGTQDGAGNRAAASDRIRRFISYVAVHAEDEGPDPDGLDQSARMALEAKAIDFILSREPRWQRTATNNPGYDLFDTNEHGNVTRWCEVKAMTGSLRNRPVGLSHTQFEHAQKYAEAYWLYVVEQAGTDRPRIVRIQDPAGRARTFTFDHGWLDIADMADEPGGEGA